MKRSPGKQGQASTGHLPVVSRRRGLVPPATSCDAVLTCCQQGSVLKTQHPGFFCGQSVLDMSENSRLPEGEHVFSVNHVVHTNSMGTVLGVVGRLPNQSSRTLAKSQPFKGEESDLLC